MYMMSKCIKKCKNENLGTCFVKLILYRLDLLTLTARVRERERERERVCVFCKINTAYRLELLTLTVHNFQIKINWDFKFCRL
jgi:hypothetical protein